MDLAKPGLISKFCQTNAVFSFKEYLLDYASPKTRGAGEKLIVEMLEKSFKTKRKKMVADRLHMIEEGKRDVYI